MQSCVSNFHLSTQKAYIRLSLERLVYFSTDLIPGQPELLHRETLFPTSKTKQMKNKITKEKTKKNGYPVTTLCLWDLVIILLSGSHNS